MGVKAKPIVSEGRSETAARALLPTGNFVTFVVDEAKNIIPLGQYDFGLTNETNEPVDIASNFEQVEVGTEFVSNIPIYSPNGHARAFISGKGTH